MRPSTLLTCATLFACLTALVSCADPKMPEYDSNALLPPEKVTTTTPADKPYILGPGDELTISVWNQEEMSRSVKVDPAGQIDYPLVGQVKTYGLTVDELRGNLEQQLATYLVQPRVDINVTGYNSLKLYVLGEVANPGVISPQQYVTPQQAVATAGGFTNNARNDYVLLVRRDHEAKAYRGYAIPMQLEASEAAIRLQGGDILFVPRSTLASVQEFMQNLNSFVTPLVNIGRGIIMVPDVVEVFTGEAFEDNTPGDSGRSVQSVVPAQ